MCLRPLHIGKLLPPPFAGIESHIDTLLSALGPEIESTLVASLPIFDTKQRLPPNYRVLTARSFGIVASAAISPGIPLIVRQELRSGRCNLLHLHAPNPWGDMCALMTPRDIPVVMTWHSDIVTQKRLLRAYKPLQQSALRRADCIIVFTPKHYDSSEQLHAIDVGSKIRHVPIGIDFSRLDSGFEHAALPKPLTSWIDDRTIILSVGRHVYYKGFTHLVSAMAGLSSESCLLMVGTGPLTSSLKQQVLELGLGQRVQFLGEVSFQLLQALLRNADVFCLPSIIRSEAFGIATAEAMACGLPAVVCELGNGVNYLNRDGITGLTVPPRNVKALGDALHVLVSDARLRRSLGKAAREWVRGEFSIGAMRRATKQIYEELLGR